MEKWQLGKLIEKDGKTGKKLQIGGSIDQMRIGAVNGPLHAINVSPVPVREMQSESWERSFVRLQVADRVVWMDLKETDALMELLILAHKASVRNYGIACPE